MKKYFFVVMTLVFSQTAHANLLADILPSEDHAEFAILDEGDNLLEATKLYNVMQAKPVSKDGISRKEFSTESGDFRMQCDWDEVMKFAVCTVSIDGRAHTQYNKAQKVVIYSVTGVDAEKILPAFSSTGSQMSYYTAGSEVIFQASKTNFLWDYLGN